MLPYTLQPEAAPEIGVSRAEAEAAGLGIAIIVAAFATLYPATAAFARIWDATQPVAGPICASLAITLPLALVVLAVAVSRRLRLGYLGLLTLGWSAAAFLHAPTGAGVLAGLGVLALGSLLTYAVSRFD